jgi:hypothetical protein
MLAGACNLDPGPNSAIGVLLLARKLVFLVFNEGSPCVLLLKERMNHNGLYTRKSAYLPCIYNLINVNLSQLPRDVACWRG